MQPKFHQRLVMTIVMTSLASIALSSCSAHDSNADGQNSVETRLDKKLGIIRFPVEQFAVSADEDETLTSAYTIKVAECANEQGVRFYPSAPTHDIANITSNYFGVWVKEYAEKYGFVGAQSDADLVANGIKGAPHVTHRGTLASRNNGKLTDGEWNVVDACHAHAKAFDSRTIAPNGPWAKAANAATDSALASEAAEKVESSYDACLEAADLDPDPGNPGFVRGSDVNVISPQQIALALKVVSCKTQVHYVESLSALVADAQAPTVAKYHKELVAQRQRIDAALVKAKKVIADYQRDHPDFK
ncbi:hypothetical protein [Luteimicrobium sp. DT211]|uniref:hypothetical protein n=1 Tax=Luteimicrobium sp. DT211 TaxID=3393412 RepID=UPI003CEAE9E5